MCKQSDHLNWAKREEKIRQKENSTEEMREIKAKNREEEKIKEDKQGKQKRQIEYKIDKRNEDNKH